MKAKQPPATPPASDEITDDDIEAAAADFPILGKIAKAVRNVVVAPSPAAAPPAPAPAPMFEPRRFSDEVQELIDANADAFDWQHDPDQSRFELLDANVALLRKLPAWSSKNDAELLAEGARRVKAELGAASAPAPAAAPAIDPRAAIENAPARFPRSIGDIGSAGGRDTQTNDVARFQSLSFEDGLADLIARG